MFWQEDNKDESYVVPDDVMDLSFNISSPLLPIDNIFLLSTALLKELPWLSEVSSSLLDISVADGNGWQQNKAGLFYPSRRSKFTIRLPKERIQDAQSIIGMTLILGEYTVDILKATTPKKLSDSSILFAKTVPTTTSSEEEFLTECAQILVSKDITPKKLMAGLERTITTDEGAIVTRSLMVADLTKSQSVHLQETGLGMNTLLGFGVFVPQKGIDTVEAV